MDDPFFFKHHHTSQEMSDAISAHMDWQKKKHDEEKPPLGPFDLFGEHDLGR